MECLTRAIVRVLLGVLKLGALFLRSSTSGRSENLVLRRQLAQYIERGTKPKRVDHAARASLSLFTRFFDWRDAIVMCARRRSCDCSPHLFDPVTATRGTRLVA